MQASDLAQVLDGELVGPDRELRGVAPLESAGPDELSFVGNRKAAAAEPASRAGCLIVPLDFPSSTQRAFLRVPDPRASFAHAIRLLHPTIRPAPAIHPSAVIAASAAIGPGVTIGPHVSIGDRAHVGPRCIVSAGCSLGPDSKIGSDCMLHPNVTLYEKVLVGDRAVLHAACTLGADGFGFVLVAGRYEKFPQIGTVQIGDDVEIGAHSCVDRAALGVTRIGHGVKLDNMVHIGHNCQIGNHVVIAAQTGLSGGVIVEDYAVIGGQVGIGDKARIESKAVLGSGCGILTSKIVRKGQLVWGTPARPLKEYLEQLANVARLPRLREEVANLRKQVAELRSQMSAHL